MALYQKGNKIYCGVGKIVSIDELADYVTSQSIDYAMEGTLQNNSIQDILKRNWVNVDLPEETLRKIATKYRKLAEVAFERVFEHLSGDIVDVVLPQTEE